VPFGWACLDRRICSLSFFIHRQSQEVTHAGKPAMPGTNQFSSSLKLMPSPHSTDCTFVRSHPSPCASSRISPDYTTSVNRDFPFDLIDCPPTRYTSYDTQALHPISMAHRTRPGTPGRRTVRYPRSDVVALGSLQILLTSPPPEATIVRFTRGKGSFRGCVRGTAIWTRSRTHWLNRWPPTTCGPFCYWLPFLPSWADSVCSGYGSTVGAGSDATFEGWTKRNMIRTCMVISDCHGRPERSWMAAGHRLGRSHLMRRLLSDAPMPADASSCGYDVTRRPVRTMSGDLKGFNHGRSRTVPSDA
jgi:hypothetical protein